MTYTEVDIMDRKENKWYLTWEGKGEIKSRLHIYETLNTKDEEGGSIKGKNVCKDFILKTFRALKHYTF